MAAYAIAQIQINDPAGYQGYLDGFMEIFARHGGELLATSKQATDVVEGHWAYPGTVIMKFPSADAAHAWHNDPDYQRIAGIRRRTADANLVIVDGIG